MQVDAFPVDEIELRKVFDSFDADGSGAVDKGECKEMAMKLGFMFNDDELDKMIAEADLDGNGEIDFTEFKAMVAKAAEGGQSGVLASLAIRKQSGGPSMKWREDRKGPGIEIEGDLVKRAGGQVGWGVQLADVFCNSAKWDAASALLEVVALEGAAYVGVVSSNFQKSKWDDPLDVSQHAVAVRCNDGSIFRKGRNLELNAKMCKIETGHFVRIECDMQDQVMTMQVLDKDSKELAKVSVDDLPVELCIAVALGSSPSEQSIRLRGSSTEKTGKKKTNKSFGHDTWDDENVQTLQVGGGGGRNSMAEVAATMA